MNQRFAHLVTLRVPEKQPETGRKSVPRTRSITKRYAELQFDALQRLNGGFCVTDGWLRRANNTARVNWHRASRDHRVPPWADRAAILAVYIRAAAQGLQCDHYYPLHGKRISGLHVHENIRVVTPEMNMAKGADSPDPESNY